MNYNSFDTKLNLLYAKMLAIKSGEDIIYKKKVI